MKRLLSFLLLAILAACARPSESGVSSVGGMSSEGEAEVMAVLDELLATFNVLDIDGWEATFHFPNVRLMSGAMNVIETPGVQPMDQILLRLEADQWHHSAWTRREIVYMDETKAHVDTDFTRYREDGSVIGTYNALYILTREDGRWGVKLSSVFTL